MKRTDLPGTRLPDRDECGQADCTWTGNSPTSGTDFGEAIRALKAGRRVARAGWDSYTWLALVTFPAGSAVELSLAPWIGIMTSKGKFAPWPATHADILAEDWHVVVKA